MEILGAEILCLQLVIIMIIVREVLSSCLLYKFNRADGRSWGLGCVINCCKQHNGHFSNNWRCLFLTCVPRQQVGSWLQNCALRFWRVKYLPSWIFCFSGYAVLPFPSTRDVPVIVICWLHAFPRPRVISRDLAADLHPCALYRRT